MASLESILRQAGFSGNGLQTAMAVAMAESGGNSRAYNPTGRDLSYGLFQINMLGSMGPSRRKQYGLASNEALFDPVTNAKVAYALSNGGKNWKPWTTYTSGKYQKYLGNNPEIAGSGSGTGGGTGGTLTPQKGLSMDDLAARYGYTLNFFKSDPTLWKLVTEATANQWTSQEFEARLKGTKWYQTYGDTYRQWRVLEHSDPGTAILRMNQTRSKLTNMANAAGIAIPEQRLKDMIWRVNAYGWDEAQVADAMALEMKYDPKRSPDTYTGMMAANASAIKEHASDFGITVSDKQTFDFLQKMVGQDITEDGIVEFIKQQAKVKYAGIADDIDRGMTVKDYASPYIQAQAKLLELNPEDVHLDDPRMAAALQNKDPKTGKNIPMTLTEFEKSVKGDARWMKTKNARDDLMEGGRQILSDWGLGT